MSTYRIACASARKLLHDVNDIEDVAQQTVLSALQARPRHRSSFAHTVARNHAYTAIRNKRRLPPVRSALVCPEDWLEKQETEELVRQAAKRLPPHQRDVIDRFYFQDQTTKTIAKETNTPHGTVCRRLQLARKRLKETLTCLFP